jgi:uncharacterized protein (DUF1697 family)
VTYIALLRAVNVTGYNRVSMSDLVRFAGDLGLAGARTLLQSGNIVFQAGRQPSDRLERLLETDAEARLRIKTEFFVRTAAEWRIIVDGNPFTAEAARDPGHLVVMFLKGAPAASQARALQSAIKGRERAVLAGKQAYIVYPDGIGRSKLTNVAIERCLGVRGTARNWNTVMKLDALAHMESADDHRRSGTA